RRSRMARSMSLSEISTLVAPLLGTSALLVSVVSAAERGAASFCASFSQPRSIPVRGRMTPIATSDGPIGQRAGKRVGSGSILMDFDMTPSFLLGFHLQKIVQPMCHAQG